MAFKTGSICSKHEKIKELANDIHDLADKCMDDGQRMEEGLKEKAKRIDTLESENDDLRLQLEKADALIASLQEENRELAAQVREQEGSAV